MGQFDFINFIFYKTKLMEIVIFFIFLLFRSNPIREYFFHRNRCTRKYFLGGCTKVGFGVYKSRGRGGVCESLSGKLPKLILQ